MSRDSQCVLGAIIGGIFGGICGVGIFHVGGGFMGMIVGAGFGVFFASKSKGE